MFDIPDPYFVCLNVLVTPSNAEFHQFDWESRQQEDYVQIKERDIQKLEIEYKRGQQSLRALSHELQKHWETVM